MKIRQDFVDFSYLSLFGDLYGHGDRTGKRELPWSRKREYINKGRKENAKCNSWRQNKSKGGNFENYFENKYNKT